MFTQEFVVQFVFVFARVGYTSLSTCSFNSFNLANFINLETCDFKCTEICCVIRF